MQNPSFCWCYSDYSSCLPKPNSSFKDYSCQFQCFSRWPFENAAVASSNYATGGAVGFRCMVLAEFVVMNSVNPLKSKKNSGVTQLPHPPQGIFGCTCTFSGAAFSLSWSFAFKNFPFCLSQKGEQPKLSPSDKCFRFFPFSHVKGTFCLESFCAYARWTFFKVGPGEQTMSNEVRINMNRAGS